MSASIGSNGCLNWQGKVGIVATDEPNLDKLRVGKISYSPQTNLFVLYTGNGRNEKFEVCNFDGTRLLYCFLDFFPST